MELKDYSTKQIVDELKHREGVEFIDIPPYEEYSVQTTVAETDDIEETGPATILVVID